jgi:hypothetical protein
MVFVRLLSGFDVVHVAKVVCMCNPNDVTVVVACQGMTFEAWDLERDDDGFVSRNWKRLS